jgi:hypothetical protein
MLDHAAQSGRHALRERGLDLYETPVPAVTALMRALIVLARLALLESVARTEILEYRNLARVHIFRNRLPFMHRDSWAGPRNSSAVAYAWFVWDADHHGLPTLNRISWEAG